MLVRKRAARGTHDTQSDLHFIKYGPVSASTPLNTVHNIGSRLPLPSCSATRVGGRENARQTLQTRLQCDQTDSAQAQLFNSTRARTHTMYTVWRSRCGERAGVLPNPTEPGTPTPLHQTYSPEPRMHNTREGRANLLQEMPGNSQEPTGPSKPQRTAGWLCPGAPYTPNNLRDCTALRSTLETTCRIEALQRT